MSKYDSYYDQREPEQNQVRLITKGTGTIATVVFALAAIIAFETGAFESIGTSSAASCQDLKANKVMDAVSLSMERSLKYPGSARYPDTSRFDFQPSGDKGNCSYILYGFVDAQNGFGALGRVNFVAMGSYDLHEKESGRVSTRIVEEHFRFLD